MNIQQTYDQWAQQYDTNPNKTRDLEAIAIREMLNKLSFYTCLEIGCGTGKNTEWLVTRVTQLTAVDLSREMLVKAQEKVNSNKVKFIQADITKNWTFANNPFDLIVFSLILEHIEFLDPVFEQASDALLPGGHLYIGELHPFKQYIGSKARFETVDGLHVAPCFNHHVSDFIHAGNKHNIGVVDMNEYFDEGDRTIPRILTLLMRKN